MYWNMAVSAWRRVPQGRRQISSALIVLKMERVNAIDGADGSRFRHRDVPYWVQ
jgi:hypothetical protein